MSFPLEEKMVATMVAAAMPLTPKQIAEQVDIYFPPIESLTFDSSGRSGTTRIMTNPEDVAKCLSFSARGRFYVRAEKESEFPNDHFTYEVSRDLRENISETPYAEAYSAALRNILERQRGSEGYS
jgi:hypothetical protein